MTGPGIAELLACVYQVCGNFQGSVTSWIRSTDHNEHVGGMATSHHLGGRACDVVYDDGPPPLSQVQAVANQWGVRLVREGDHDHFQV